jgi:putative DNA primase/helicase
MSAIRNARRWGTYRLVPRADGTFNKVPSLPTNRPERWTNFDAARRSARHAGGGLGLAFLLGDGWAGIDLDAVALDPAFTRATVDAVGAAYVEASVSGTGLHVVARGSRSCEVDLRSSPPKVVEWTGPRFFAMSLNGRGDPDTDITSVVDVLLAQRAARRASPVAERRTGFHFAPDLSDDDLLLVIVSNNDRFIKLFRGDTSDYPSHSEADLALCSILAWWTNFDQARVDRLFRLSGLMRDKWSDRASYREWTLRKAVA